MATTVSAITMLLLLMSPAGSLWARPTPSGADTSLPKASVPIRPKLLYVVEGNQDYMIPYIERKLINLRKPDTDSTLYRSVVNLNILAATTGIEARVFDILRET